MYFYPLGRGDQFVSGERLYFLLSIDGGSLIIFIQYNDLHKVMLFLFCYFLLDYELDQL